MRTLTSHETNAINGGGTQAGLQRQVNFVQTALSITNPLYGIALEISEGVEAASQWFSDVKGQVDPNG